MTATAFAPALAPGATAPITTAVAAPKSITAENFDYLIKLIYGDSGIVLDRSKEYLLESRLLPVAKANGATNLDGLSQLLRTGAKGPPLRNAVVEALTTNETLFFRDVSPFEALRTMILPKLIEARAATKKLSFLSAACSSGQEAYSISMLLQEQNLPGWQFDILGIDLSHAILNRAKAGRFSQLEVNRGLPAKYLVKYFTKTGNDWDLKPEVKRPCRWQSANLKESLANLGRFDVVFCRNVLIYFDLQTKKGVLQNLRKVMNPMSYLLLGSSETTINIDESFIRQSIANTTIYQTP